MSEVTKFDAQKKKLDGICEEHDLVYRFRKDQYPIMLTISPMQGVGEQLSLLGNAEGKDYISPNACMTWIYADGELSSKVSGGTFTISKTLRSKIENIFLKMVAFWTQYFFRDVIERGSLRRGMMPVINEDDADDSGDEDSPSEEEHDDDFTYSDEEQSAEDDDQGEPDEDRVTAATLLIRQENKASVSLLQRRLNIGYAAAARLMDVLEQRGVVGPYRGAEPREVLPADVPED